MTASENGQEKSEQWTIPQRRRTESCGRTWSPTPLGLELDDDDNEIDTSLRYVMIGYVTLLAFQALHRANSTDYILHW